MAGYYSFLFIVLSFGFVVNCSIGVDHCKYNVFTTNSTLMHFTKEIVAEEFAVYGGFKSLHCCAKFYKSIEWYKDGKPYPWSAESSTLILYPEAANQTVYTHGATISDRGNYSCVLSNDTIKTTRVIHLEVVERAPDTPRATYVPEDQGAVIGAPARLYCEAFVGHVDIPDAHSDIQWKFSAEGVHELQPPSGEVEVVRRESGQIIGALLLIPEVTRSHLGRYVCSVGFGPSAPKLEMSAMLNDNGVTSMGTTPWTPGIVFAIAVLGALVAAAIVIKLVMIASKACTSKRYTDTNRCTNQTNQEARV